MRFHLFQAFLETAAAEQPYEGSHDLELSEDFPRNINCGPKPTSTQYYTRDFLVDRPKKSPPLNRPASIHERQQLLFQCDVTDLLLLPIFHYSILKA